MNTINIEVDSVHEKSIKIKWDFQLVGCWIWVFCNVFYHIYFKCWLHSIRCTLHKHIDCILQTFDIYICHFKTYLLNGTPQFAYECAGIYFFDVLIYLHNFAFCQFPHRKLNYNTLNLLNLSVGIRYFDN